MSDAADPFCRYCGRRQTAGQAWFYHPIPILILAFFVLGPFALPLVWLSSKMNPPVKAALSAVIIVYTAFTVYYAYELTVMIMRHFSALGDLQRIM